MPFNPDFLTSLMFNFNRPYTTGKMLLQTSHIETDQEIHCDDVDASTAQKSLFTQNLLLSDM